MIFAFLIVRALFLSCLARLCVCNFPLIRQLSDAGVPSSAPVDSGEGGASGLSMGACTAGWESGSGEDRGGPSSSMLCTATGPGEATLAVSKGAVASQRRSRSD